MAADSLRCLASIRNLFGAELACESQEDQYILETSKLQRIHEFVLPPNSLMDASSEAAEQSYFDTCMHHADSNTQLSNPGTKAAKGCYCHKTILNIWRQERSEKARA